MWGKYHRLDLFSSNHLTYVSQTAFFFQESMQKDRIDDSSFVVITGPPQKDKSKRISHVRSMIRKSQLRRDGQLQARTVARGPLAES